jgi:glycosyltransferase involved in cell wall biosynthesis
MRLGGSLALPNCRPTKKFLMDPLISLIVPVWGDDELAVNLVNSLPVIPELAEWIVVAVHPAQSLRDLDRRGAIQLISCNQPSRGSQMNAGASAARGKLLCFHHCDTELRPEHLSALEQVVRNRAIIGGAFHRRFRAQHTLWREPLVRWLSKLGGPLFGDQSIFVDASIFRKLGGFADIPLMEDLEFSRRLRRTGRIVILDPPLWSPPRRLGRLGTWWRTFRNTAFIGLFYLGVDPHTLHSWYYRLPRIHPNSNPNQSQSSENDAHD